MLRRIMIFVLVLAALAAPAVLQAAGPHAGIADRPSLQGSFGGSGATAATAQHRPAANAPTTLWAAVGGFIDPDGLNSTAPEPLGSFDLFLVWLRALLSL